MLKIVFTKLPTITWKRLELFAFSSLKPVFFNESLPIVLSSLSSITKSCSSYLLLIFWPVFAPSDSKCYWDSRNRPFTGAAHPQTNHLRGVIFIFLQLVTDISVWMETFPFQSTASSTISLSFHSIPYYLPQVYTKIHIFPLHYARNVDSEWQHLIYSFDKSAIM